MNHLDSILIEIVDVSIFVGPVGVDGVKIPDFIEDVCKKNRMTSPADSVDVL